MINWNYNPNDCLNKKRCGVYNLYIHLKEGGKKLEENRKEENTPHRYVLLYDITFQNFTYYPKSFSQVSTV